MPDASAKIPIAAMLQIDARIIVSLYLAVCRPSGCGADGKWPKSLSPRTIGMATRGLRLHGPSGKQDLGAWRYDWPHDIISMRACLALP